MADQDENKVNPTPEEEPTTDTPEAAPATDSGADPAPPEPTEDAPAADPQPGGEVVTDPEANAQVLGEDQDEEFDAVAHGQQTALENHQAEKRAQPTS